MSKRGAQATVGHRTGHRPHRRTTPRQQRHDSRMYISHLDGAGPLLEDVELGPPLLPLPDDDLPRVHVQGGHGVDDGLAGRQRHHLEQQVVLHRVFNQVLHLLGLLDHLRG